MPEQKPPENWECWLCGCDTGKPYVEDESMTVENADDIIEFFGESEDYGYLNILNFIRYAFAGNAYIHVNPEQDSLAKALPYLKAEAILNKAIIELMEIDWSGTHGEN